MEDFKITKPGGPGSGIHIMGFRDAAKLISLVGPKPRRLAHLALHLHDLHTAKTCLEALMTGQRDPIRGALWFTAIVCFLKCFGSSGDRFQLVPSKIYKGNALALEAFRFFEDMRNKHYVHDENPFSQSLPGAVINKPGSDHKIAKIVTLQAHSDILGQENFTNLRLLIDGALAWVQQEYDGLAESITADLEAKSHADLLTEPEMVYRKPDATQAADRRSSP